MAFGLRRAKVLGYIVRAISIQAFQPDGLRKTIFSARLRFSRSRTFKVMTLNDLERLILAPIESAFATSYSSVIVTLVLSRTVSEIFAGFLLRN